MLYVAADRPLPRIPWDDGNPGFYVAKLSDQELRVARQFRRPHLAYLGAHTGCSCGFCPEQEDEPLATASLAALRSYLEVMVAEYGPLELFACWDGDQEQEPGHRYRLRAGDLGREHIGSVDPPWFADIVA